MKLQGRAAGLAVACMAVCGGAVAQTSGSSLTVYGQLGAGLTYRNHLTGDNSRKELTKNLLTPSMIGFRGVEDLGGGMSALFNLEADVDTDTGNAGLAGKFWSRQSFVGLNITPNVTVTAGRQFHVHTERLVYSQDVYHAAQTSLAAAALGFYGNRFSGFLDTRVDNSVKLRVKGPAGLTTGVSVGAGEGSNRSLSLDLAQVTPHYAIGAWAVKFQSPNRIPGTDDRAEQTMWGIGGNVPLGPVRLYLLYADIEIDSLLAAAPETQTVKLVDLGARWQISPAWAVRVSYIHERGRDLNGVAGRDGTKQAGVASIEYALSKRTDLSLTAYTNRYKDGFQQEALNIAFLQRDPAASSTSGVSLGIRHAF